MTLLSGIRNLIARRREPASGEHAAGAMLVDEDESIGGTGTGATVEIEAKETVRDSEGDRAVADPEFAERLKEIDTRLGAAGIETRRIMQDLRGHMETSSGEIQQLLRKLDEQSARLLQSVAAQAARREEGDKAVAVAIDAAAQRFAAAAARNDEAVHGIATQLRSLTQAVDRSAEQGDKLAKTLDDVRERTTGLNDAIARIGHSIVQREGTFFDLLNETRRSVIIVAVVCGIASLAALGAAVVALMV